MFLNRVRDPVLCSQERDRIDGDGVAEGELLGHGFGKGFPPRGLAVSDREDDFQRRVQGKEVWVDFAGGGVDGGAVAPETVRDGGEALRVGLPGGGVGFGPDKGAEGVAVCGVVEAFLGGVFFLIFELAGSINGDDVRPCGGMGRNLGSRERLLGTMSRFAEGRRR